jgi:hypothetical protein
MHTTVSMHSTDGVAASQIVLNLSTSVWFRAMKLESRARCRCAVLEAEKRRLSRHLRNAKARDRRAQMRAVLSRYEMNASWWAFKTNKEVIEAITVLREVEEALRANQALEKRAAAIKRAAEIAWQN